jgi:hypothetical protein
LLRIPPSREGVQLEIWNWKHPSESSWYKSILIFQYHFLKTIKFTKALRSVQLENDLGFSWSFSRFQTKYLTNYQ